MADTCLCDLGYILWVDGRGLQTNGSDACGVTVT